MKALIYGNGGSGNHGCEAIARGTETILQEELWIQSINPEQDEKYGLTGIGKVCNAITGDKNWLSFLKAYLKLKLSGNYTEMDGIAYLSGIREAKGKVDVALSVGGDNYCYGYTELYAYLNKSYRKAGFKTVLWGCSIEPEVVKKSPVIADLRGYDLIVARESITYNAIQSIGANVILAPDPAFSMPPESFEIDARFDKGNVVGINISPMIISNEHQEGIAYENYKELIQHILEKTDMQIALIPHVVWEHNDDRTVLKKLYQEFNQDSRIIMVDDYSAPRLKYIISKCRLFVGARTHATIAAYSSCVPTLVVGYSVKARGIARDLFGTEEQYVLPVQSLDNVYQLTECFKWLSANEEQIRKHFTNVMSDYVKRSQVAKRALEALVK